MAPEVTITSVPGRSARRRAARPWRQCASRSASTPGIGAYWLWPVAHGLRHRLDQRRIAVEVGEALRQVDAPCSLASRVITAKMLTPTSGSFEVTGTVPGMILATYRQRDEGASGADGAVAYRWVPTRTVRHSRHPVRTLGTIIPGGGFKMIRRAIFVFVALVATASLTLQAGSAPARARLGMVITQSDIASQIGFKVIEDGGNAIDAAVATAFALAVTHPTAGNIGGGGFIVYPAGQRASRCRTTSARWPRRAPSPDDVAEGRQYDVDTHHNSHLSSACPARSRACTWRGRNTARSPGSELVEPAVALARDGFVVSHGLARSLDADDPRVQEIPRLARAVLQERPRRTRPARSSCSPTWRGRCSASPTRGRPASTRARPRSSIEKEMKANGGLITQADLKAYQAKKRARR